MPHKKALILYPILLLLVNIANGQELAFFHPIFQVERSCFSLNSAAVGGELGSMFTISNTMEFNDDVGELRSMNLFFDKSTRKNWGWGLAFENRNGQITNEMSLAPSFSKTYFLNENSRISFGAGIKTVMISLGSLVNYRSTFLLFSVNPGFRFQRKNTFIGISAIMQSLQIGRPAYKIMELPLILYQESSVSLMIGTKLMMNRNLTFKPIFLYSNSQTSETLKITNFESKSFHIDYLDVLASLLWKEKYALSLNLGFTKATQSFVFGDTGTRFGFQISRSIGQFSFAISKTYHSQNANNYQLSSPLQVAISCQLK